MRQQFKQIMSNDSIRVVCRLRPLNKIQIANKGQECVTYTSKDITITVGGQQNKYNFAFDRIFGPHSHQVEIYKEVAVPVIKAVIGGFNGTIFAYGQTGGGKTWTMEGPNHHDHEFKGLIPRTIEGLFQAISQGDQNLEFVIKCSYIEIYNEKLFDLLDPSKSRLQIKEDKHRGVFIQNCTEINVGSSEQMLKTMDSGASNRKVAFTGMNERSSRSHSIFIIYVNQKNLKKDSTKQTGSQKVSKTGCQGTQLQQAKNINKSLSSLGNVINALTSDKKQHIPYRDSKLTRILQESLGGNSKTTLIINCSICTYNDKETLGTLRFGYRAKSIKNKAKVNEQKSAKELLILLDAANRSIAELKLQLGGKMPMKVQEQAADNTSDRQESNALIEELKQKLEQTRREELQKQRQLKQMQFRIKNVLLQLADTRQSYTTHTQTCSLIFKTLKGNLSRLNKFMSRVYIDLQYWITNLIVDGSEEGEQIKTNLNRTFQSIMDFTSYYEKEIKSFFTSIQQDQGQKIQSSEHIQERSDSRGKKIKMIYSEPNLMDSNSTINEDLQMSCIVDKKSEMQQDNTVVNSDKVSQQQSFTQIETLLQSLQTKQSHKILIQQMSYNLKSLKKQNEQLLSTNQKLIIQNKLIAQRIQQQFQQRIIDLQQRVDEYRNIIKQKDNEITNYLRQIQKQKNTISNEKVISDRLKKVIDSNANLKSYYEMQQRLRSLANERQKLFNQYYKVRNELDDAEITIKQKQQHIESLKQVMKELTVHPEVEEPVNQKQIQKKYANKIYGTDTPNIVMAVRGGTKTQHSISETKQKQSSLRRKVSHLNDRRQEGKGNILPFIKGFFS